MQAGSRCFWHTRQADSTDAFAVFFCGDGNQRFADSIASLARTNPAHESLVDLDGTLETVPSRTHHGPAEFVKPAPSRFVTAQTQNTLQAQRTGTGLLARHKPHSAKPHL